MSGYKNALNTIINRSDLNEADAFSLMNELLEGQLSSEQIAGLLTALLTKGESIEEVKGFVKAMRQKSTQLVTELKVVDTCGTGGDGTNTFNISTTAAFITAGAGVPVAKHHNRSVSSQCGSADLLEALGIDLQVPLKEVENAVNEVGLGFCFAPLFHPSMKYAAAPRKALGIRTVFNLLGPMLNPFNAKRQVIGIFSKEKMNFVARLLKELGSERILIVHGSDGMDEATLTGPTHLVELKNGELSEYLLEPEKLGFATYKAGDFSGGDARHNAAISKSILGGEKSAKAEIAILNTALSIYVGTDNITLADAVDQARSACENGLGLKKMEELMRFHSQPEVA